MAGESNAVRAGKAFVEIFASTLGLERGLQRAAAKLSSFGDQVQRIGMKMVSFATMAGAPLALSAKTFMDFEATMSRVKALRQGATAESLEALNREAQRLGAETKFSATQAAEAMVVLAEQGYTVGEIFKATKQVLDLAAVGNLDLAVSAKIATNIMGGMEISAGQLVPVIDLLAKASATAGNSSLPELGEAMKKVGRLALNLGVSLEDTVAALQVLSRTGIAGEEAGVALRGILLSLVSPGAEGSEARKMLKSLGIEVLDAQGKFVGLAEAADRVQKAIGGMEGGQAINKLGQAIPDNRLNALLVLAGAGGKEIRQRSSALAGSQGFAATAAAIQMDNLKGSVETLMSSLEGFQIAIGEAIGPMLRDLAEVVGALAGSFAEWAKENKGAIQAFAKYVLVIGGLGAGIVALGLSLKVAAFAMSAFAFAFSPTFLMIRYGATAVYALGKALHDLSPAFRASVQGWVENLRDMGRSIADTFGRAQGLATTALEGVSEAILGSNIPLAMEILLEGVRAVWEEVWGDLGNFALNQLSKIGGWAVKAVSFLGGNNTKEMFEFIDQDVQREINERNKATKAASAERLRKLRMRAEEAEVTRLLDETDKYFAEGAAGEDAFADVPRIKNAIGGAAALQALESKGTFNVFAAAGLGAEKLAEKAFTVAQKQLEELKGIKKEVAGGLPIRVV